MIDNYFSTLKQLVLSAMLATLLSVLKKLVLTGFFILTITVASFAAAPSSPGDLNLDAGAGYTAASSVPIDAGLSLLIAAGVGLRAGRKMRESQKKAKP